MQNRKNALLVLAACGAAIGIQGAANAQPFVVNISGATLLQNTIRVDPATTNDFIDANNNGSFGPSTGPAAPEQLSPGPYDVGLAGFPADTWWAVQYRSVGSVNGVQELFDWGAPNWAVGPESDEELPTEDATDGAFQNRTVYVQPSNPGPQGPIGSIFLLANPGAAPTRSFQTTVGGDLAYEATRTNAANTGIQIDIAVTDVPIRWAVRVPVAPRGQSVDADFDRNPGLIGYGSNPRTTVNKDGTPNGFDHLLANLGVRNLNLPPNDDSNTIFDYYVAWAPIAPITNFGTGMQNIAMSNLRHLFVTGRLNTGENLMAVTRDSGSGTRNGFNNTTDTDPSWGVGENVGGFANSTPDTLAGPSFIPGQKGGGSALEATTRNTRLGIGYAGPERGNGSWLTGGQLEFLAVKNDLHPDSTGAAQFVRPELSNIIFNASPDTSFRIGGPGSFGSIGDANAEPISEGGLNNGNTPMANPYAAQYLNNILRSIEAFTAVPGGSSNFFMPAEQIATRIILPTGLNSSASLTDPMSWSSTPPNMGVQTAIQGISVLGDTFHATIVGANPRNANNPYEGFGYSVKGRPNLNGTTVIETDSRAGKASTRQQNVTYSDGVSGTTQTYIYQDGTTVAYNANLALRNLVAGDFSGNGVRDINDAAEMLKAWRQRNGGPAWVAPAGNGALATLGNTVGQGLADADGYGSGRACIELLGDFNNDGNFGRIWNGVSFVADTSDVRYWADGLAMLNGALNRCEGFKRIDTEWNTLLGVTDANGFFDTSLAHGTYSPGDAVADVAGAIGATPGFAPVGHDGSVDADDIDYVYAQFKQNARVSDGALNWAVTTEAIGGDLSCDINGDLIIDQADITKILTILETTLGDVNLDGTVDSVDAGIAQANLGNPGGWADGDVNGDGTVTQADIDLINPPFVCCVGNADGNNVVDFDDITTILSNWLEGNGPSSPNQDGDANCDGDVDFDDITDVLSNWLDTCP